MSDFQTRSLAWQARKREYIANKQQPIDKGQLNLYLPKAIHDQVRQFATQLRTEYEEQTLFAERLRLALEFEFNNPAPTNY